MCPHRRPCLSKNFALLNRRDWVKLFVFGSVTNLALGGPKTDRKVARRNRGAPKGASAPRKQAIVAEFAPSTNGSCVVPVRLSEFTPLQSVGQSMQIFFSNYINPFIVTRAEENLFYAFDSTCTHQGFAVDPYNASDGVMTCTNHGSTFDIEGNVIFPVGGPDQGNLNRLKTSFDGNDLVEVEIPGVPLRIETLTLQSRTVSNTRLRLQFFGTQGCRYTVQRYTSLTAAPQAVGFATRVADVASANSLLVSQGASGIKTIWVDSPGPQGFFVIRMAISPYLPL